MFFCGQLKDDSGIKRSFEILRLLGFTALFLIVGLQTFTHARLFLSERAVFGSISQEEKKIIFFADMYGFAQYCRIQFPGKHRGEFITDADLAKEPYMSYHRKIAYYLFPGIDIRGIYQDLPVDCFVAVFKKDVEASVPKDFRILGCYKRNFCLAVRKDLVK